MKTKILITLMVLVSLVAGGFFIYKNIFVPEKETEVPSAVEKEKSEGEEIEIFKDTKFEWGFAKFSASNLPENERCEIPVQGKKPVWTVAEVATETHFCKNLPQPKSADPIIIFESEGGHKKLYSYKDSRIKLLLDSSVEEKQGCRITNPITPESWWPHYGVVQYMLVDFADFEELNFSVDAKLNKFKLKIPDQDCTKYDATVEKYGEFIIVFLLQRKDGSDSPSNLFWLLLVTCSKHWWPGARPEDRECTSNSAEYILRDQFGIVMYHPPMGNKHPILKEGGQWATYNFDLKELAKDAVNYHNSRHDPDIDLDDYYLGHVNFGWEMVGAFDTEIELKNLSLKGRYAADQQ